jgi:hypothetical protein
MKKHFLEKMNKKMLFFQARCGGVFLIAGRGFVVHEAPAYHRVLLEVFFYFTTTFLPLTM